LHLFNKSLPYTGLIIILVCIVTAPVLAAAPRTVEGTIVDIYNDEEAGAAYVTITTATGLFIIDCKHKSFDTVIAPQDYVKVVVNRVRTLNKKLVGDLVTVVKHTPAKH
jgi:hypothetical protein